MINQHQRLHPTHANNYQKVLDRSWYKWTLELMQVYYSETFDPNITGFSKAIMMLGDL